jgi:hypothetical protein
MVLMSENLSNHRPVLQQFRVLRNYGTGPSLSRPTMPAKVREGGGGYHHAIGRRDQDGQPGHIISPSWVSHFPARHSCIGQGLQSNFQINK